MAISAVSSGGTLLLHVLPALSLWTTTILLAVLSVLWHCCFVARSLPEAGVPLSCVRCVRIVQLASGWKGKRAAAAMGNTCVGWGGVCGEGEKSKAQSSAENL